MKSWLQKTNKEIYSKKFEEKSVAAETFVRL